MSYEVQPLQASELDDLLRVWWAAFEPEDADQALPMIYPRGLQPDLAARLRARVVNATKNDIPAFCSCAKDVRTGEVVGVAWRSGLIEPAPGAAADEATLERELQAALAAKNAPPVVEGMNVALGDAFYTALFRAEKETVSFRGLPHVTLQLLAVLPGHSRRGIGGMLVRHFLERVDELGVYAYLTASGHGKGLYERHGFRVTGDLDFDGRKHGGRSEGRHWVMLRPVHGKGDPGVAD